MAIKTIDYDKCTDCSICWMICPMDVFKHAGRLYYIANEGSCMTCYLCEMECPDNAIYVSPERAREPVMPY